MRLAGLLFAGLTSPFGGLAAAGFAPGLSGAELTAAVLGPLQDRLLFGKDSFQPDEYPYYWRTFETGDEYFDYYRDYHAFWKLYGMELPDDVLRKLYYRNALRITPGLPQSGW